MKRSGTPEHMLSEAGAGVELRPLGRGGVVPAVSSPGRQSLQSQYTPAQQYSSQHAAAVSGPHPVYSTSRSYAPSTTYNPGYQQQEGGGGGPPASRRYQSEGQLLGEAGQQAAVGSSTSAGQLQVGLIILPLGDAEIEYFTVYPRSWRGRHRDHSTCGSSHLLITISILRRQPRTQPRPCTAEATPTLSR